MMTGQILNRVREWCSKMIPESEDSRRKAVKFILEYCSRYGSDPGRVKDFLEEMWNCNRYNLRNITRRQAYLNNYIRYHDEDYIKVKLRYGDRGQRKDMPYHKLRCKIKVIAHLGLFLKDKKLLAEALILSLLVIDEIPVKELLLYRW